MCSTINQDSKDKIEAISVELINPYFIEKMFDFKLQYIIIEKKIIG